MQRLKIRDGIAPVFSNDNPLLLPALENVAQAPAADADLLTHLFQSVFRQPVRMRHTVHGGVFFRREKTQPQKFMKHVIRALAGAPVEFQGKDGVIHETRGLFVAELQIDTIGIGHQIRVEAVSPQSADVSAEGHGMHLIEQHTPAAVGEAPYFDRAFQQIENVVSLVGRVADAAVGRSSVNHNAALFQLRLDQGIKMYRAQNVLPLQPSRPVHISDHP